MINFPTPNFQSSGADPQPRPLPGIGRGSDGTRPADASVLLSPCHSLETSRAQAWSMMLSPTHNPTNPKATG